MPEYQPNVNELNIISNHLLSWSERISKSAPGEIDLEWMKGFIIGNVDHMQTAWPNSKLAEWFVSSVGPAILKSSNVKEIGCICQHAAAAIDVELMSIQNTTKNWTTLEIEELLKILRSDELFRSEMKKLLEEESA